jgi:hypothetical protein
LLSLLLVASAACDAAHSDPPKETSVVCPSCQPMAGGETSDFGAATAACVPAYLRREVDQAEADSLGFAAAAVAHVMQQPIAAMMTWDALDTKGGGPARGYEAKTHVELALTVGPYAYYELDPAACDATTCLVTTDATVERVDTAGCPRRLLMVTASGDLRTRDGAIAVALPRQAVKILRPDEKADQVSVAARANLRDVHGKLQLDPAIAEPRLGVLDLSLQYTAKGELEYGVIDISIYPDWDNLPDGGPTPTADVSQYRPLQGRWDTPPPEAPKTGAQPSPQ